MKRSTFVSLPITFAVLGGLLVVAGLRHTGAGQARDEPATPQRAEKLFNDGNWKEAYEAYSRLALDPEADPRQVGVYLTNAVQCLRTLGRRNEIDAFRENVVDAHSTNWRLLRDAARTYFHGTHYGFIIAGEFERGPHRGGGKAVNSYERDRARGLQLLQRAMPLAEGDKGASGGEVAGFYAELATYLVGQRGYHEAWRLQYLTDLSTLPDYEEGHYWYGGRTRGAPVDADGDPVYHKLPDSWEAAESDGERWRWALMQQVEHNPGSADAVRRTFADFLWQQFGVQTMAEYRWFFGRGAEADGEGADESGTYALHTLGDGETIAKLATGIRRFDLPEEFNFIRIYQALAEKGDTQAIQRLGELFQNRRQYPTAADWWQRHLEVTGRWEKFKDKPYTYHPTKPTVHAWEQLRQVRGNWGMFEPVMTQPAGRGATVEYRFRNGRKVRFTAHEIDVAKLLDDVKDYLRSHPKDPDWRRMNIGDVGHRLVRENETKYLGRKVAEWDLDPAPRPDHFDKRITVTTPLQKAGAYLVVAEMAGGNTTRIVLWVADTAIVKTPLDGQTHHFVADAVTGRPIPKANVEFFGYQRRYVRKARSRGHYEVDTKQFAEFTGPDGQVLLGPDRMPSNYQWIVIARTPAGRLAYLGFTGVWYGNYHDREYNQTKYYAVTDRPVYRPEQTVKFKVWVNQAQYDREGPSPYADHKFAIEVYNPKDEKVYEDVFAADEYGGFDGELALPDEAGLGIWSIRLANSQQIGTFRVEEYKKPEFEVTIEAPDEPVMLGETVKAKVEARYYFGAPVTEARAKYKVLRTEHTARWYPVAEWDWFYGRGYWWFAYDYPWWPGWEKWGCPAPVPWWWWQRHPRQPPEVVAEGETEIGPEGTMKVPIDTAVAKAIHPDQDHRYEVTVEVTDKGRRTIVGRGEVLVARQPFKVYAWVDRGHYRVGDTVRAHFNAQRLDSKPVRGEGVLKLYRVTYTPDAKPVETQVQRWDLDTNAEGRAEVQIGAARAGQFRLSYTVTDSKGHEIEGGYVFVVRGEGGAGEDYRFNDIELVPDKRDYRPGEKVRLAVRTNRAGGTVLLFERPSNGVYLKPKVLRLRGKGRIEPVEVTKKDMPNFFVEAVTVSDGDVHRALREIVVPPEDRTLTVEVTPSAEEYKPGEKATVKVKLTDSTGEPFQGSTVVSIYDKAVEYISGGSNVPEIKEFFWKWRRHHRPRHETNLARGTYRLLRQGEVAMAFLGVFGYAVPEEVPLDDQMGQRGGRMQPRAGLGGGGMNRTFDAPMPMGATPAPGMAMREAEGLAFDAAGAKGGEAPAEPQMAEPTVRTQFADTALWVAALATDEKGEAEVSLTMPEDLTTWKTRAWAMGDGTRCGEGTAEVVTTKNVIVRLQAPRFFVQKDEVVLSAVVHNYLKTAKTAQVVLEVDANILEPMVEFVGLRADSEDGTRLVKVTKTVEIEAGGEERVDWRVKAVEPGEAVVRMKALTDEESDAMEMRFPVYVHGMLKTESFCGVVRPDAKANRVTIRVPAERRPKEGRLEVRYSPTLAMAMIDALPYLAEYPYGCTEQTLNRFLPAVITQNVLMRMDVDLAGVREKITNLNAQEIGDDLKRMKDWKRLVGEKRWDGEKWVDRSPVFEEGKIENMVKAGVERLTSMQNGDGGWGWFSGREERSWPHTTGVVVHGLQTARENDVAIVPGVLERGIRWLKRHQAEEVRKLRLHEKTGGRKGKPTATNLDAFVYMVLVDEKHDDAEMRGFLYRDRTHLAVYTKAMFGLALHKAGHPDQRDMLIRNVEQFLVEDDENQTAYLKLPNQGWWWYWYGSEYEAHAYYLKLLAATNPKGRTASRLVKYLLNNRRHATYWNSTRDTALVIEAFADYLKATGEHKPDMTVEVLVDGNVLKTVRITSEDLFSFDNKLVLEAEEVTTGEHTLELRRRGEGPLYWNAYLTNFTLEDPITRAGLEIKVRRKYYKLVPVEKTVPDAGSRGQVVERRVEKYERRPLRNLALLKSGDLVEIELEIESKNDYEYILFEDMKAAGFEPVELRSGYHEDGLRAYMELRDERVTFFVQRLARGRHSIAYRMRAEIPGRFSALPTKASAMYAAELKANSDEMKVRIED